MCSDPERVWYPQRSICYAEAEARAADRKYTAMHQERPYHDGKFANWSERATPFTPYHYDDGVNIYVAPFDINPDDNFLNSGEAVPDGGSS